jgi:flagellar basal-body rod modification protein FlgD
MEDFLTLMVAQLENQDPSKPLENTDFLSQIAQFSTVSGIEGLQTSFTDLSSSLHANQAVEAASLVGRQVITDGNVSTLAEGQALGGTIDLPENASAVTVYVQDLAGGLVHSQPLGARSSGGHAFRWDGMDADGEQLSPGQYRLSAEAVVNGEVRSVSVYSHELVESVSVGKSGSSVMLNLQGGGNASMADIKGFL